MEKPILEIKNLKKQYIMGTIGTTTLIEDWKAFWDKRKGKEDERIQLGQERLVGKKFMALNGVNLTVYPGEAVGIIGINGAGKSTMLKLVSRITAPSSGEIVLRGKISSMLEVGTGFEQELTGRENIYMSGTILGMKKAEIDAKMDDIIAFSECKDFIDTPVKRYSSGMYVKLAFSVAAHLDSDIMIMDEVLAVGDSAFQNKCLNRMNQEARSGKTILYVSHNMSTIRQLCTRVVVMKEGKIIHDGDVEEGIRIYSNESFKFGLRQEFKQPESYSPTQKAVITAIEVTGRDNLVFSSEEKLNLKVSLKVLENLENALITITPRYAGANIAGAFITAPFSVQKQDEASANISLDISNITPGKYFCDITISDLSAGRLFSYDEHISAFGFEITNNHNQQSVQWNNAKWGYTVFPTASVVVENGNN